MKKHFKMKKLDRLLTDAANETETLLNNPSKLNAEICEAANDLAQIELQRLIQELKDK